MRRFKTNSASSASSTTATSNNNTTTGEGRSGMTGLLFKSASSPTPPTDEYMQTLQTCTLLTRQSTDTGITITATTASAEPPPTPKSPSPTPNATQAAAAARPEKSASAGSRSGQLLRNYGRAINRSFHTGITYVSGGGGGGSDSKNKAPDCDPFKIDDSALLSVGGADQGNGTLSQNNGGSPHSPTASSSSAPPAPSSSPSKSSLSPKMPSRFMFSKNKAKSSSGSWYSSGKSKQEQHPFKQGSSCPGWLESEPCLSPNDVQAATTSTDKPKNSSNKKAEKLKSSKQSKSNSRPLLMRQQQDEHSNVLIEKALSADSNHSQLSELSSNVGVKQKSNKSNMSKLRKMCALDSSVVTATPPPPPTDIVFEEGTSNKVTGRG